MKYSQHEIKKNTKIYQKVIKKVMNFSRKHKQKSNSNKCLSIGVLVIRIGVSVVVNSTHTQLTRIRQTARKLLELADYCFKLIIARLPIQREAEHLELAQEPLAKHLATRR